MAGEDRVPDGRRILRLVPQDERRFPPGSTRPSLVAFELSTGDKAQVPPRLSVFDTACTTFEQARAIHGRFDTLPFSLLVDLVRGIALGGDPLDVRYDPLQPPKSELLGADGHAGIWGLRAGSKNEQKNARAALASLCTPFKE
jgi:hypothetical protein